MNVADYLECIEKIDVRQATNEVIDETADVLSEANRQQMKEGVNSEGEIIRWQKDSHYPYTPAYARKKAKAGLQILVVDLKFEGGFHNALKTSRKDSSIQFDAPTPITEFLEENYTPKIFGLNDEKTAKYTEETFLPAFKEKIGQQSGLY